MKRVSTMWHVVVRGDDDETFAFLFVAMQDGILNAVFKHRGKEGKDLHYHCLLCFKKPIDFRDIAPVGLVAEPCHSRKAFISYGANEREAST